MTASSVSGKLWLNDDFADLAAFIGELRRWITSNTCQSPTGAYYAWIDGKTHRPSFEYPEITGYALTYLSHLSELEEDVLDTARRAANWLVQRIQQADLSAHENYEGGAVYNFDLAMIATGLLSLGRRLNVESYIATGSLLVKKIHQQILAKGTLPSLSVLYPTKPIRSCWSTQGSAHLLKVVQCLLLARSMDLLNTVISAEALFASTQKLQSDDGRFITQPGDTAVFLHPHLYAAEGLWIWGTAYRDTDALQRAKNAVRWLWQYQLDTGGFPGIVYSSKNKNNAIEQSDVTGQAIRLALLLGMPLPGLTRAIKRLGEIVVANGGAQAVVYQPDSASLHLNTWSTLFCLQALETLITEPSTLQWCQLV